MRSRFTVFLCVIALCGMAGQAYSQTTDEERVRAEDVQRCEESKKQMGDEAFAGLTCEELVELSEPRRPPLVRVEISEESQR